MKTNSFLLVLFLSVPALVVAADLDKLVEHYISYYKKMLVEIAYEFDRSRSDHLVPVALRW